jgi:DNA-binding transcriptional LysR family regulator
MLDVRRLRLLRDLAQLGTIAAVAKSHMYTPSAVSQQLAALEREAGVALLMRTGRRVALTPAGHVLVRHAEVVLAALEQADAALAAARADLAGPLRIGAFPSAVTTLLAGALVSLGEDHPALELTVTELDPVAVPDAIREGRLDVALTHDYTIMPSAPDEALDSVPLLEETVFLAVPRAVGGAPPGADPLFPAGDPRAGPWIVGSPGTVCHAVAQQLCRADGVVPRIRHHADDFGAVLALVAAGQGVAIVPQLAADRPPEGVRLVPLDARRRTTVAFRQGAGDHPAIAAFVAALRRSTAAYLHSESPSAASK